MGVYYIDSVNGSDSNDGSSISTAWATLAKAITDGADVDGASADTTFYLAPGSIFREDVAAGETNKNVGYRCTWYGDREAAIFTNHTPGAIVHTNVEDPVTLSTSAASPMRTSHRNTYIAMDFYAHNHSTATGLYQGPSAGRPGNATASRCLIVGDKYGAYRGPHLEDCVIMGGDGTVSQTISADRCVIIGGRFGITQTFGPITNCIAIGSGYSYYNNTNAAVEVVNCTAVGGGSFGFANNTVGRRNLALWTQYGFRTGASSRYESSSIAYGVAYPMSQGTQYNISASRGGFAHSTQYGDATAGQCAELFWHYEDVMQIANTFYPYSKDTGITTVSQRAGFTDRSTELQAELKLDMMSSSYSKNEVGHLAQQGHLRYDLTSSAGTAISSSHPGIIFQTYGERVFQIPVPSGSAVTASVGVKHTGTVAAAEKPAIVLQYGNLFDPHSSTAVRTRALSTVGTDTWETLTVSSAPLSRDGVYDLRLQFYSTASGVEGYFSDLNIS